MAGGTQRCLPSDATEVAEDGSHYVRPLNRLKYFPTVASQVLTAFRQTQPNEHQESPFSELQMSIGLTEIENPSPFVARAEQALKALKYRVTAHVDRETQIRRYYSEWQENLLMRSDQLRQQIAELEARMAPWIPRVDSLRLTVVSRSEELPDRLH